MKFFKDVLKKVKLYGFRKSLIYIISELKYILVSNLFFHSYSQFGEDLILDDLLGWKNKGFYVDVGAFNPDRFSNTKHFYNKGWRGINIEPNPLNYAAFLRKRPRDINLNIGVSTKKSELNFYSMFPPTLSTFSKDTAKDYAKKGYTLLGEYKVSVDNLKNIFSTHIPPSGIDFLSIDTEGYDLEVLKSNDWKLYPPRFVCIESAVYEEEEDHSFGFSLKEFLISKGYEHVLDTSVTSIYKYIDK